MQTKRFQPSGVVLLMVAGLAAAGCSTVESTELMIEVRTKDLDFAPDPGPAEIDEIEIRILRLVGSARELDAGPLDAGPRDAAPRDAAPLDAAVVVDAEVLDASADDAGAALDVDAGITDAAVPDAAAPTRDAGAVLVPARCPARPAAFADGPYVFTEKWCGRYAIPRGARPPLTLGIVPSDGDSSSALIEIRATAYLAGREVVDVRRLAGFVPNTLKRIPPLVLSAGCIGVVCPPEQTCNDDVCVPLEVPPMCLPAAGVDAGAGWASCGASDGGPFDAGPPDAGPADAGPIDAGPSCGDRSCNGGETCSSCEADCGACGPVCGDGSCDGDETCDSCGDCQNGHLRTRPFMEPCSSDLNGVWRCVTSSSGPCVGERVSERCQGGVWAIWSCNPANCARCVCSGSLDPFCMDAP